MNFKAISNAELMQLTANEVRIERCSTLKIIKLFQEIQSRKLFLEYGFSSFYEMVTKQFGYCAGSAMRRINAMKLVREMPQFEQKIATGELSLSVASDVQTFLYQEAKIERPYSLTAKIELVESCVGKSRREVEEEFVRRNPEREKRESVHGISHDRLRVSFSISKELNDKLNQLKDLLSHVDPSMTTEALVGHLAELGLDRHDPIRKAARAKIRKQAQSREQDERPLSRPKVMQGRPCGAEVAVNCGAAASNEMAEGNSEATSAEEVGRTRYIPAEQKHRISYDGKGCTFTSPSTGRRCYSTKFLQIDHVRPFAKGGPNTAENLRWVCGAHNRFRAQPMKSSMDSPRHATAH